MNLKFLVLIIILDVVRGNSESDVYIKPYGNTACPSHPCLTLNEYAKDLNHYLMNDSTIVFLPGNHHLDIVMELENVVNITLTALSNQEINDDVQVIIGLSAYFKWTTGNNIEINGIIFIVPNEVSGTDDGCSVLFFQETTCLLSNLTILGNHKSQSTAIGFSDSSQVTISFMIVRGVTSLQGVAAFHAVNSTIEFVGQNIFDSNTATNSSGGAGVLDSCNINVTGSILFTNNTAAECGGALVLVNSIWNVYGNILFFNNSALIHGGAVVLNDSDFYSYGNSSFINNTVSLQNESSSSNFVGGGAIYSANTQLYFSGYALFQFNSASTFLDDDSQIKAKGGAILAYYRSKLIFENTSNTSFKENNSTHLGGAISISVESTLVIQRGATAVFNKNCAYRIGGGAIYEEHNSTIYCNGWGIVFEYNAGLRIKGGAIYTTSSCLEVVESLFIGNFARNAGGSIFASQSFVNTSSSRYINNTVNWFGGVLYIEQSTVFLDGNHFTGSNAGVGGAIIGDGSKMIFSGQNNFINNTAWYNKGGAISSFNTVFNIRGTLSFISNSAPSGGAMAIGGTSKLILNDNLQLNFITNDAKFYGGAILFENLGLCQDSETAYGPDCHIELSSKYSIKLNFIYNSAGKSGSVFFGGGFNMCQLYIGSRDDCGNKIYGGNYASGDPFNVVKNVSHIVSRFQINATSEFSSNPYQVCFCINGSIDCNPRKEIRTITGMLIVLYVAVVGQYMDIVPSSVRISMMEDIQIRTTQQTQKTNKECTELQYRLFSISEAATFTLYPECDDEICCTAKTKINVTFCPCPEGFILDKSIMECVCEQNLQQYTQNCSIDTNSIERKSNSFWMGAVYDNNTFEGFILHAGCPFDYCVNTPILIQLDNLDIQCNHNHSGTLCGSCKHHHSIVFGTLHCMPCTNVYIALIVPFAFAGLALVAMLLLLNLSIANGMINGLIFYANIIQANYSAFFPSKKHSDILTIFIAWMNLDLGIETCFYDGMTIYAFTWLQFLFPFYIWFLIALIIMLSHFSDRVANSLGSNPVATLATLLLLSYSKILRSIIAVFTVAKLEYPDGTSKLVWLYDGSVPYFQRTDHIVLGTFAIMASVILFLPYTLLLFCGPWLQVFSHKWMFSWLNKIKPFMDAYHAPYKKHTRFWIGLLLLVRCIIFLVTALDTLGNNKLTLLIIISIAVFLATLAWVHHRIYEKFHNDILEASFILNLCILAAGTYHIENSNIGGNQAGLTYTSVGIAFTTFICILIYHIYLRLLKMSALKAISDTVKGVCSDCRKKIDTDDNLESVGPTTSSVKLLESLLESR